VRDAIAYSNRYYSRSRTGALPGADSAPQKATIPLSGLSLKRALIPSGYTPLAQRGALPVVFLPLFFDAPTSF
jgi:hypothetical protein